MRKVVDGKLYDTEKAEEIADGGSRGMTSSDFRYHKETLYQTKKGSFFLVGEGGAMSRWREAYGNAFGGGSGLQPISAEEAREWMEGEGVDPDEIIKYLDRAGLKIEEA